MLFIILLCFLELLSSRSQRGVERTCKYSTGFKKKHVCVVPQPWFRYVLGSTPYLHRRFLFFPSWSIIRFYLQHCTKSSSSWSCCNRVKVLSSDAECLFLIPIIKLNSYLSSAQNCRINKRYSCSLIQRHIYGYYISNIKSEGSDIYCV